jgi:hypothetical protein
MALHRPSSVVIGVPNIEDTARYYTDFGLAPIDPGPAGERAFRTVDGGEQLRLVPTPFRRGRCDTRGRADDPSSAESRRLPVRPDG